MNTLLTETIDNEETLINLDNVSCFKYIEENITRVYFNDTEFIDIKEYFENIVDMLHGD